MLVSFLSIYLISQSDKSTGIYWLFFFPLVEDNQRGYSPAKTPWTFQPSYVRTNSHITYHCTYSIYKQALILFISHRSSIILYNTKPYQKSWVPPFCCFLMLRLENVRGRWLQRRPTRTWAQSWLPFPGLGNLRTLASWIAWKLGLANVLILSVNHITQQIYIYIFIFIFLLFINYIL